MGKEWEAVYAVSQSISAEGSLRIANLAIAAACRHVRARKRPSFWHGRAIKQGVHELALDPLPTVNDDKSSWNRLAECAYDASHLGLSAEGMHAWAAAFQRATSTQKQLGAYATHHAFAKAIVRRAISPLAMKTTLRIIDPCVGAGNLLLAAIQEFASAKRDRDPKEFIHNLYGVEIDSRSRELCCLLIWLAGVTFGVKLDQVVRNIQVANALTMEWWQDQELFDVLLINPPWESLRHKVEDDARGERSTTRERLSRLHPGAKDLPPLFSAQGTGDRNLFKAFVELVPHLLVEGGRLGALFPAAFASDAGLSELRKRYLEQFEIARWTSFENRAGYFPIDKRYKFGLLAATRSQKGTRKLWIRGFATEPHEINAPHILLRQQDIAIVGRKYHILPELSRKRELSVLRHVLSSGCAFFECGPLGEVTYRREIDLSLAKDEYCHVTSLQLSACSDGTLIDQEMGCYVPLIEGRLVGAYDCFKKSWISGSGRTAIWTENKCEPITNCTSQYVTSPVSNLPPRVAVCDITAATNTRTVIATLVPATWRCGNTAPVLEFNSYSRALAGLGILNSMVFDWVARRLVSGLHLNKFILEGFVWPRLSTAQLKKLAFAAWSICVSKPRSGLVGITRETLPFYSQGKRLREPMQPFAANVAIELIVARGLGLSSQDLAIIYDPDVSDRRGFWRYFKSEPSALKVCGEAVRRLTTN